MKYKFEELRMSGWKRFFHKILMFILFPVRRPIIFILLILVLFLAPVFLAKVTPRYVHNWYKEQFISLYIKAEKKVKSNISLPKTFEEAGRGMDQIVDLPTTKVKTTRRKSFEKPQTVLRSAPPPGLESINPNLEFVEEEIVIPQYSDTIDDDLYDEEIEEEYSIDDLLGADTEKKGQHRIRTNLPLKYLAKPQEISGIVKVINANSIEVDDNFLFFYGIYSNPVSEGGQKAEKLLKDTIEGREVDCSIIAYTYEDVATAMCYVGNKSINHVLVNKGYARNVALQQ